MKFAIISLSAFFVFLVCNGQQHQHRNRWRTRNLSQKDRQHFKEWRGKFKKHYKSQAEEEDAMKKLAVNEGDINAHNELFKQGIKTFERGLWEHSDMSAEEKEKFLTGVKTPRQARALPMMPRPPQFARGPKSVDWRAKGLVGPVESQQWCGSCWAYSTKGVVEAMLRRMGINEPVSPQQLVDCSKDSCWGCGGGWPKYALDYFKNNGFTSESKYPYFGYDRNCTYKQEMRLPGVLNHTYNVYTAGNETWLKDIVGSIGPVSILMSVGNTFFNYKSGVYYDPACSKDVNHAMLLVGYGNDRDAGPYWTVKNSWGTSWGEQGYVRVARNKNNTCNIAHSAVFAT